MNVNTKCTNKMGEIEWSWMSNEINEILNEANWNIAISQYLNVRDGNITHLYTSTMEEGEVRIGELNRRVDGLLPCDFSCWHSFLGKSLVCIALFAIPKN